MKTLSLNLPHTQKIKIKFCYGCLLVSCNVLLIIFSVYFLYLYNFTQKLILVQYSQLSLCLDTYIGLIGILLGVFVLRHKISFKQAVVIQTALTFTAAYITL